MAAVDADSLRNIARGISVPRVLVVDDEENLRELVELTLVGMGLDVDTAPDLASARELIAQRRYALCLTDMRMPDGNGLELVAQMAAEQPDTPIAVITAFGSADNAVAALKAGAFDYLSKPVAVDALRALVRSALNLPRAEDPERRDERAARDRGADRQGGAVPEGRGPRGAGAVPERPVAGTVAMRQASLMIGRSAAIDAVRASIARMTRSMAPVAITGESGSGKELAARLVHELGARAGGPFIAVNCGAIPENLMESEFFGYRKGAFTGADSDRAGFFTAASGGTLFLDEVADLPLPMQVKLLRAIQEKRVRRVGAVNEEAVDVRIISATHQDLARCVSDGRFRQDLYYRLNVIELRMPSLRERREDVPMLAESILARLAERNNGQPAPRLSSVTLSFLQRYDFPGNVRELENILERALAFSDGRTINVEDLGLRPWSGDQVAPVLGGAGPGAASVDADEAVEAVSPLAVRRPEPAVQAAGAVLSAVASDDDGSAVALLDQSGVPRSLPDYLDRLEREAIERALVKTGNNRTAAARELGITFRALRHRMQRLVIG